MKKRNILRASGALLIFAVLGLLSACEIFTPYEPEGGRLSLDKESLDLTVGQTGVINVTAIKSSKINSPYFLEWSLSERDQPIAFTVATKDNPSDFIYPPARDPTDAPPLDPTDVFPFPVKKTTTFIFTVTSFKSGTTNLNIDFDLVKRSVTITVNSATP